MYPKRGEISHRLSCNRVGAAKCMIMASGFWREQFCEACRSNTTLVLAFRLKISMGGNFGGRSIKNWVDWLGQLFLMKRPFGEETRQKLKR